MDNSVDLPGYKYYVDPEGERPDVKVTFVNIEAAPGESVTGVVIPFDERLDLRERNYERREVGPDLCAYFGSAEARARFDEGPAVVSREYLAQVPGEGDPGVPVWDLRRVDLP